MLLTSALGLNIGLPERFELKQVEEYEFYVVLNVLRQRVLYKGQLALYEHPCSHATLAYHLNNRLAAEFKPTIIKGTKRHAHSSVAFVLYKDDYLKSAVVKGRLPVELKELKVTSREQTWRIAMNSNCFVKQPNGTFTSFYSVYPRYELPPAYLTDLEEVCVITDDTDFTKLNEVIKHNET